MGHGSEAGAGTDLGDWRQRSKQHGADRWELADVCECANGAGVDTDGADKFGAIIDENTPASDAKVRRA